MVALADAIRAVRAEKPVVALVNDIAASAAYTSSDRAFQLLGCAGGPRPERSAGWWRRLASDFF
jgi:hypothetical protein